MKIYEMKVRVCVDDAPEVDSVITAKGIESALRKLVEPWVRFSPAFLEVDVDECKLVYEEDNNAGFFSEHASKHILENMLGEKDFLRVRLFSGTMPFYADDPIYPGSKLLLETVAYRSKSTYVNMDPEAQRLRIDIHTEPSQFLDDGVPTFFRVYDKEIDSIYYQGPVDLDGSCIPAAKKGETLKDFSITIWCQ